MKRIKRTNIILSKEYRVGIAKECTTVKLTHRPCYKYEGQGVVGFYVSGAKLDHLLMTCTSCRKPTPEDIKKKTLFLANSK